VSDAEPNRLLPAVRGDLLLKLGRRAEAKAEPEKAALMATNAPERDLLPEPPFAPLERPAGDAAGAAAHAADRHAGRASPPRDVCVPAVEVALDDKNPQVRERGPW
jgi:hypothetical protein